MKARWLGVLLLMISACLQPDNTPDKNVMKMADLECRAISLREQRFMLANKIRFAQDTLLHYKTGIDSVRLKDSLRYYQAEKETVLQASLQLADTIHNQLDSLRKFVFKNVDEKHAFDDLLQKELEKRDCNL